MRSIRSTNNNRRSRGLKALRRRRAADLSWTIACGPDCGQCEGTGTIEGGLSGDGDDEECPVCDGLGVLPALD